MANPKVEVIIEAITKNFDKIPPQLAQGIEKYADSFSKLGIVVAGAGIAIGAAQKAWSATVGELVTYGEEVRKLSLITGQSAEETSRQIQLTDRLGVSYSALTSALRTATKNDIDVTVDGLVRLGEQYKALPPGIERATFLTKKFGAEGSEMGKVLEKTSEQIRDIVANTPDGLILGDEDIKAIEEYNRSADELRDTLADLKMTVGREVLPAFNDMARMATGNIEAITGLGDAWEKAKRGEQSFADYAADIVNRTLPSFMRDGKETAEAINDIGNAAEDTGESLEDLAKRADATAKRMSGLYKDISKGAFDIMKSNRDYADDLDDLAKKEEDLKQERIDIEYDLYKLREDANKNSLRIDEDYANKRADILEKIERAQYDRSKAKTDAQILSKNRQIEDLQERLAELDKKNKYKEGDALDKFTEKESDLYKKLLENEDDLKELDEKRLEVDRQKIEADNQKKYNLLEQRAMIDGIISSGENEWLLEQAVNLGLITPAARDAAIAQSQWADAMYASFAKTQPGMEETLRLMQEMYAYDGKTVNFGVNFTSNRPTGYAATSQGAGTGQSASGSTSAQRAAEFMSNLLNNNSGWRDSGGLGFAGQPYMIGTGAQPEMFVPNSNGTFIPNADKFMGTTYNIVINNPKRETAENSIRTSLKKLSYTGVAQ